MSSGKRDVTKEVEMMKSVAEVLLQRRENPGIDSEQLMKLVTRFIAKEGSPESKIYMVAAASKAVSLVEKNSRLTDKEVIRSVMADLPRMTEDINSNNSPAKY